MANPEHVAELKKGVLSWNEWIITRQKAEPSFRPDLRGIDLSAKEWRETPLYDIERKRIRLDVGDGIDFGSDFDKIGINLTNCDLDDANMRSIDMVQAVLCGAIFYGAHLDDAYVRMCTANGHTRFRRSHLNRVHFEGSEFGGADFAYSNIDGTDFSNTRVDGCFFLHARYSRKHLLGCYSGIGGLDSAWGNAKWRRDAQDQDLIDSFYEDSLFLEPTYAKARALGRVEKRDSTLMHIRWASIAAILPKRLLFWLWSWTDYGRSLVSVLALALLAIGVLGSWYTILAKSGDVVLLPSIGVENFWSPFYIAVMGFATLGLTDIVKPMSALGQAAMISNVLAGFFTLGLTLAVLSQKVARRS